jgi:hypothetical protein
VLEDSPDGGSTEAMAELEQFALDALVAPGLILPDQLLDQIGDGVFDGRATRSVCFAGRRLLSPSLHRACAGTGRGEGGG